jgi:hypothetical protein
MIGSDDPDCNYITNPNCWTEAAPVEGLAVNSYLNSRIVATAVDSKLNYYFSDMNNKLYRIDAAGNLKILLSGWGITTMTLFEDADGTIHFFTTNGTSLRHFSLASGAGQASAVDTLCVQGGYFNGASQINKLNDGNLIISDTQNNRIIKYYIRDRQGALALNSSKSCK